MLENTDWLDEGTKRQIKEKVNGITTYFQYPKELLNDTYVSDFYAGLTFSNESYFEKEMIVKKWSTDVSFSRLRKSSDTEEWKKRIRSIDFNPLGNSNGFPHLFSHPLFNRDRPA
ncbi:Metalloendopeptidase-like protein PEX, partial [Stegodyphus mimosarum]